MNPFLKPFACHWTMLDNVRVRKAGDVRLKATRTVFIYCAPCMFLNYILELRIRPCEALLYMKFILFI
jgi:hypothetical protein